MDDAVDTLHRLGRKAWFAVVGSAQIIDKALYRVNVQSVQLAKLVAPIALLGVVSAWDGFYNVFLAFISFSQFIYSSLLFTPDLTKTSHFLRSILK